MYVCVCMCVYIYIYIYAPATEDETFSLVLVRGFALYASIRLQARHALWEDNHVVAYYPFIGLCFQAFNVRFGGSEVCFGNAETYMNILNSYIQTLERR